MPGRMMPRPKKSSYANEKPPLSYVALCVMAIRSSSSGMMSLNEIYRFIVNTFPYYKNTHSKWRNSLRHNLSFNDCFVKIVQGSENGNKRSLWSLHPSCGDMFEDGSLLRRKRRFMTSKRRQKEDAGLHKLEYPAEVDESSLVASIMPNGGDGNTMPKQRDMSQTRAFERKQLVPGHGDRAIVDEKSKERLTNFTIDNILRESFPPQKRKMETRQRCIDMNSIFMPDKSFCGLKQRFDQILQNCTCNTILQTVSPCRYCFEMPMQRICCYGCKSISQQSKSFGWNQKYVKSSKESFTLHYKAHWS